MFANWFTINECDKSVYVKDTKNGYIILCLYVDDILIVSNNDKVIKCTKNKLNSKFDMEDIRHADVILGFKISRILNGLIFNQSHHINKYWKILIKIIMVLLEYL